MSAFALTGATCDKNGAGGEPARPTAATKAEAPPPEQPKVADVDEGAVNSDLILQDIPGLDFSELPAPAKKELAAVFTDEFCYCGCPHTVGACLKQHPQCKHAKRMALLAAGEAAAGAMSTDIIVLLSKYYLSFRDRVKLPQPDSRMCLGPADAKVTLLEFSDFECPFCGAAAPVLEAFQKAHPDVRFCYQPFPLQSHPHALPAAQAALFARDHGKFWQMHDLLFANQTALSREKILELGESIGLPKDALGKALDSGQYLDELKASKELGHTVHLDHTPTVFINGREHLLGVSTELLQHSVEDELEWQANGGAWAKD